MCSLSSSRSKSAMSLSSFGAPYSVHVLMTWSANYDDSNKNKRSNICTTFEHIAGTHTRCNRRSVKLLLDNCL